MPNLSDQRPLQYTEEQALKDRDRQDLLSQDWKWYEFLYRTADTMALGDIAMPHPGDPTTYNFTAGGGPGLNGLPSLNITNSTPGGTNIIVGSPQDDDDDNWDVDIIIDENGFPKFVPRAKPCYILSSEYTGIQNKTGAVVSGVKSIAPGEIYLQGEKYNKIVSATGHFALIGVMNSFDYLANAIYLETADGTKVCETISVDFTVPYSGGVALGGIGADASYTYGQAHKMSDGWSRFKSCMAGKYPEC